MPVVVTTHISKGGHDSDHQKTYAPGDDFQMKEGHLIILSVADGDVAIYAPGHWETAEVVPS